VQEWCDRVRRWLEVPLRSLAADAPALEAGITLQIGSPHSPVAAVLETVTLRARRATCWSQTQTQSAIRTGDVSEGEQIARW